MRYVPPFANIKQLLRFGTVRGETVVTLTYDEMQTLIRTLLTAFEVDEAFYLSQNPDVAQGVKDVTIQSARGHFIDHGYFQGRQASHVVIDEAWYLEQNPDIAEVVKRGEYESAQAHFDGPGYQEGRLPFPVR